jgi:multidrug efflux pump
MLLGVAPLVLASGAGAEMRRPLGTAVFRGMIGVNLSGIFLTPVFYYAVRWFGDRRGPHESATQQTRALSDS